MSDKACFTGTQRVVQDRDMARTTIDIDAAACADVMRRYRFATRQEAVNFALRKLAGGAASLDEARAMRGSGWEGDLNVMRGDQTRFSE